MYQILIAIFLFATFCPEVVSAQKKVDQNALPIAKANTSLVYKAEKTLSDYGQVELGSFATSKYKQLRIALVNDGFEAKPLKSKAELAPRLKLAEVGLIRQRELLSEGVISQADFNNRKEEVDLLKVEYERAPERVLPALAIYAIEGDDEIPLMVFSEPLVARSFVVEAPPSRLSVRVFGKGTHKLFVWGK